MTKHCVRLFGKLSAISVGSFLMVYAYYQLGESSFASVGHQPDTILKMSKKSATQESVKRLGMVDPVPILVIFNEANANQALHRKLRMAVSSLLQHSTVPVWLLVVGDEASRSVAQNLLQLLRDGESGNKLELVTYLDASKLGKIIQTKLGPIMDFFRHKPSSYYGAALFFLSMIIDSGSVLAEAVTTNVDKTEIGRIISIKRLVMLDIDIKFRADLKDLVSKFDDFDSTQVIGMASEMTPVYRHVFSRYRSEHSGTVVGEPVTTGGGKGNPGFNSGVVLIDLENNSSLNKLAELQSFSYLSYLVKKYKFKGHLGDQDFYSLASMEHPELFYRLPCSWNRQLCEWWRGHGYADVFDQYFECADRIRLYHGNCDTPMPDD